MATKNIIALDMGTHSIKVATYDPQGTLVDHSVHLHRVPVSEFDDETTNVRPAPDAPSEDADATTERDVTTSDVNTAAQSAYAKLAELAADGTFVGSEVVTVLPNWLKAATVHVETPFADRDKNENILPHMLSDQLPIDMRRATYDFQGFEKETEGAEVVVGFSVSDDVQSYLNALFVSGIDPISVGVAPLLLGQFASRRLESESAFVLVDMGHESTHIVAMHGDRPLLARSIQNGGWKITNAIAKQFRVVEEEAERLKHQYAAIVDQNGDQNEEMRRLSEAIVTGITPMVRDIRRSLQGLFARTGTSVESIYITGGTSEIKNLEKYLSEQWGVRVRRLPTEGPLTALVLAAGETEVTDRLRGRRINLRQGDLRYSGGASATRKLAIRLGIAAMLIVCLILGVFFLQKMGYEARRDAMQESLAKQSKKILGEKTTKVSDIKRILAGEESAGDNIVPRMSAYEIAHEIVTKIDKNTEITLSRFEVDIGRNVIQLVGNTTDAQAVDTMVTELSEIECFKKVTPGKLKVKNEKTQFELSISSECS